MKRAIEGVQSRDSKDEVLESHFVELRKFTHQDPVSYRYLQKFHPPFHACDLHQILKFAASCGHQNVLKLLIVDGRVSLKGENHMAIRYAMRRGYIKSLLPILDSKEYASGIEHNESLDMEIQSVIQHYSGQYHVIRLLEQYKYTMPKGCIPSALKRYEEYKMIEGDLCKKIGLSCAYHIYKLPEFRMKHGAQLLEQIYEFYYCASELPIELIKLITLNLVPEEFRIAFFTIGELREPTEEETKVALNLDYSAYATRKHIAYLNCALNAEKSRFSVLL